MKDLYYDNLVFFLFDIALNFFVHIQENVPWFFKLVGNFSTCICLQTLSHSFLTRLVRVQKIKRRNKQIQRSLTEGSSIMQKTFSLHVKWVWFLVTFCYFILLLFKYVDQRNAPVLG